MSNHHKINYVELPAQNIAATKAFFTKAFGWSFQDYGPEYCAIQDAGLDGGFYHADLKASQAEGSALVVLYSDHLEDSLKAVQEAGGTIIKDIFSFPGGRRFHFTEPSGNEFAIWGE
tara:strand:- start:325 stop:675 length:351 start_codon:yes stop_codon:yes gene_type:complete